MICPEGAYRASLTDDEFWDHVYPDTDEPDEEPIVSEVALSTTGPCAECGAITACAYDAEGRPLIHANSQEIGE